MPLDPEDDPQRTPGRRRRPLSREVVWTVILALVWARACAATRHTFALIFGGWVIGWLSATIARVVYPPPRTPPRRNHARLEAVADGGNTVSVVELAASTSTRKYSDP